MADLIAIDEKTCVAGQIQLDDLPEIAAEGIELIVNNRPDGEAVFGQPAAKDIEAEAEKHGLVFVNLPFAMPTFSPEHVAKFAEILSGSHGRILAYCRTGNRSTLLWAAASVALGAPLETVLTQAADAGYDLRPAAQLIEDFAQAAIME